MRRLNAPPVNRSMTSTLFDRCLPSRASSLRRSCAISLPFKSTKTDHGLRWTTRLWDSWRNMRPTCSRLDASMELQLDGKYPGAAINRMLTLAALPSLSHLCLGLFAFEQVELRLLAASQSLTDLTLTGSSRGAPKFTPAQVDQLFDSRTSAALRHRTLDEELRRARAFPAATRHCTLAGHRQRGC